MRGIHRLQNSKAIEEVVKRVFTPNLLTALKQKHNLREEAVFRWQRVVKTLLPLGGASEGNHLTIYSDGDDAFSAMWNAIENAKKKVCMETYIYSPDTIGKKTMESLTNAASRGAEVRLIVDSLGSKKVSNTFLAPLREAGGIVETFNPLILLPWKMVRWGFFRTHRKILIVDGSIGFCGGMNVGDQYAGIKTGGNAFFRDTHVKVEGPAVKDLAKVFRDSLQQMQAVNAPATFGMTKRFKKLQKKLKLKRPVQSSTKEGDKYIKTGDKDNSISKDTVQGDQNTELKNQITLTRNDLHQDIIAVHPEDKGVFVQVLMSNIPRNKRHIQKALQLTLRECTSHCYITNPYFLPPNKVKLAILKAARNGVDIRILTSGLSDVPMVRYASNYIYALFLRNNVRVYEYYGARLHAKTVTIDGIYSSIGSFNLDQWSHDHNLELNLTILDPQTAEQLEEQFMKDLSQSQEITLASLETKSYFIRFVHWISYRIVRGFETLVGIFPKR